MPYILVAAAVTIFVVGLTKLRGAPAPHRIPWGSLMVWAVLLGAGFTAWLTAHAR